MTTPDPYEASRLASLVALVRAAVKPPTAVELERGFKALRAEAARKTRPAVSLQKGVLAAALVSLLVAGIVLVPSLLGRSKVAERPVVVTRVEGGKLLDGGYVSEVGHTGVRLFFSEGSKFVLSPGTRGRLRAMTSEGVTLALDRGSASFQVTRSAERRWSVEAGPFVVSVQGTEFTVTWEPASEEFELQLRHGRVVVSGPLVGEELVLRPGQELNVSLANGETRIRDARPGKVPAAAGAELPVPAMVSAEPALSAAPESLSTANAERADQKPERRWREALANGQWDRILADVERAGVEASVGSLSSDELFMLADAARYGRRPDVARAALLAQRARFPNSKRALDAVFLLGRVEEMRAGGKSQAIERYDEYLARAPAGTYAAEALGRRMILVKDVQGPDRARHVAEEYLRRFPNGSYAEAARKLARGRSEP